MTLNFHDHSLLDLTVDWVRGSATVRLAWDDEVHTVVVEGLAEMQVPRFQPWGRSESVNSLWADQLQDGRWHLSIEMQSGDRILIVGRDVTENARTRGTPPPAS
jgi:hypothetical protein